MLFLAAIPQDFFSTLKFKSLGRQLRARLQDAKSCNSEQYTTVEQYINIHV